MSNNLTMWNLDPISDFPASSSSPSGYDRRFLTENSILLLTRMNLGSGEFNSVEFMDSRLVSAVQSAPVFFRQKLNLGAILYLDPSGCSNVQYDRAYMFTTYDSKITSVQMTRMKTMYLDRKTGQLWYSRCQLHHAVHQLYLERGSPSEIGICLSVSFSGDVEPYKKISAVRERIPSSDFSYSSCSESRSGNCMLVPDTEQNVTIYSSMDNTPLVCPIVCADSATPFTFYRNGQKLIPPASSDWSDFGAQGVRIARTSNIIEFSKDVTSSQAGEYRCIAGSASFTYYVSVVSMPTFSASIGGQSATVPSKVFAMQGESLSYSCGVTYSGLISAVSLQPLFFLPSVSSSVLTWTEQSMASFNNFVSPSGSSAVSISTPAVGAGVQLMNVSIQSVPPQQPSFGYNFTHRFLCNAKVSGTDAANLGMSSYGTQSGGDIVYIPRPTKEGFVLGENNDCATQKCYLGNGATFNFALSLEYLSYLNYIGVDVDLFLRIDNLLLTDVKILMSSNVSIIRSNKTSISYEILPITDEAVRTELQKRSSLTPVYNFRYRNGSEMGNAKIQKGRYGSPTVALGSKDCRTDPLCFYSTDFDVSGSLSFLSVTLDFNKPQPPLSTANMTIMIVVIVVCVVLIIVLVVLVVYFAKREPAKSYALEEKELEQGRNPNAEAKDEEFKEYVRQSEAPGMRGDDIEMRGTAYDNSSFMYESVGPDQAVAAPENIQVEQTDQV
ncbi:hypothetical protein BOX15_Mlig020816g1 [Macrostomum lignano]|uniref:Ig-like domain-containing protein n=1 Tax=Macrostomum lignano TaxID=282301 RepID=A0A267EBV3_9PLAT|nr:hypothetical protein BOX15_Mlig020816g1 [Macrostomum lignano]